MPPSFKTSGVALATILTVSFVAVEAQAQAQAPAEASDKDIIALLVPDLDGVRLLTMSDLSAVQIANVGDTPEVGRRLEGDFNADGRIDLALFGSSSSGEFVLVATRNEASWERAGLLQYTRPFLVGRVDHDVLRLFFCTGCDSGMRVTWTGDGYEFVPFPPQGAPE